MRRWASRRRVSGFSGFRGAALDQSRSAGECILTYYVGTDANISEVLHVAKKKGGTGASAENMRYRIYSASSLTDSLRSVVRLRRAVRAYWRGGNFLENARKKLNREAKATAKPFSIGSAP